MATRLSGKIKLMDLRNKKVLVTGSSSGIGQAIAIECAKAEAEILIHYRKNKKGAEETLGEVQKYSKGKIFCADLSRKDEIKRMFEETKTLDVLVNNAGEYQPGEFGDLELWRSQFENIFFGAVSTTNEFLKIKGPERIRKIVNIVSVYGIPNMGNPSAPQYSAAKAALSSFTLTLAKKLAPRVLVNAVAPGYTWTHAWEGTSKEGLKYCENQTRIKRFTAPAEIASMVVELLRNDAVTGEIIQVDGGLHLTNLE